MYKVFFFTPTEYAKKEGYTPFWIPVSEFGTISDSLKELFYWHETEMSTPRN